MLDKLSGGVPTPESGPGDYHVFAKDILDIAQNKYNDVRLIALATELSTLLDVQSPCSIFFTIKSSAVKRKIGEILERLEDIKQLEKSPNKIEIIPSVETKILIGKNLDKHGNNGPINLNPWGVGIFKMAPRWGVFLRNVRFTTDYNLLFTNFNPNTFLNQLLAALLKKSPESGPFDQYIDLILDDEVSISVCVHDHHYGECYPKFHHDMGVSIEIFFKKKIDAEKFLEKVRKLRFEDFFLPGFRDLLFPSLLGKLQKRIRSITSQLRNALQKDTESRLF